MQFPFVGPYTKYLCLMAAAFLCTTGLLAQAPSAPQSAPKIPPLATSGETHEKTLSDVAPSALAKCPSAKDAAYGRSLEKAVKVGGGDFKGPDRELAFLHVLRGPSGQGISIKRLGSAIDAQGDFIDIYEISYKGLAEADHLYLDEYKWATPEIPQGYTCSGSIPLKKP